MTTCGGITAFLISLSLVVLAACHGESPNATADDTARAKVACAAKPDYQPTMGSKELTKINAYCAGKPCAWRKKVAELCYFYGPRTEGKYEVHTTLLTGETTAREDLCDDLRASGAFAMATPIHVVCGDGKRCTACGVSGGGR